MDVFQRPFVAPRHADDAALVAGHGVVNDPGVLRAGDVDPPAAIGVDQVIGDDSAFLVDLEEDARAVVMMTNVAEDADVAVFGVEPNAVRGDVVGGLAVADRAAEIRRGCTSSLRNASRHGNGDSY